jgi:hypothetical protein
MPTIYDYAPDTDFSGVSVRHPTIRTVGTVVSLRRINGNIRWGIIWEGDDNVAFSFVGNGCNLEVVGDTVLRNTMGQSLWVVRWKRYHESATFVHLEVFESLDEADKCFHYLMDRVHGQPLHGLLGKVVCVHPPLETEIRKSFSALVKNDVVDTPDAPAKKRQRLERLEKTVKEAWDEAARRNTEEALHKLLAITEVILTVVLEGETK